MDKLPVKRTERGWPAHFCGAKDCLFRRNTLLECGETLVIVSTVGNYAPRDKDITLLGYNEDQPRFFETKAFRANLIAGYWEIDPIDNLAFDAPWYIIAKDAESLPKNVDNDADAMHEAVVAEFTAKLEQCAFV